MGYNVTYRLEMDVQGAAQESQQLYQTELGTLLKAGQIAKGVKIPLDSTTLRDFILFKLRLDRTAEYMLAEKFDTIRERGKPPRDVVFGDGEGYWDDHEEYLSDFSALWPGVLFTLHADGEEPGDRKVTYFYGGKMQVEKQGEWVPPPFDIKKLK